MAKGIYIGNKSIKGIYIGSTLIKGVYLGSTPLWQSSGDGGGSTTDNAIDYITTTRSTNGINYMQIKNSHSSRSIKVYISFNVSSVAYVQTSTETIAPNTTVQWGSNNGMSNFKITSAEFV